MKESISAVEARRKLGGMLNRVALRGEEIIIERAGRKIARLSPVNEKRPLAAGKLDFRKAAGDWAGKYGRMWMWRPIFVGKETHGNRPESRGPGLFDTALSSISSKSIPAISRP